jgi:hypothetical protein
MGADREELHHGRLVERQALGLEHELFRQADIVGHPAVEMHAEDAEVAAAIGPALAARDALAAGNIGNDRDHVAGREPAAGGRFFHCRRQLVAHHAWIGEIGLVAGEYVQVRAADSDTAQAQQNLSVAALRLLAFDSRQLAGRIADDGQHDRLSGGAADDASSSR